MSDLFAGLRRAKAAADAAAARQDAYRRYMASRRKAGWSQADVDEYAGLIEVLMGSDDKASLALYPEGVFATADEARAEAVEFWKRAA